MKRDLEKNRLDLAYQRQLYHLNACLILLTIGLLSFIGSFIWNREFFDIGFITSIIIFIIGIFWYKKINNSLKNISKKTGEL